MERKNNGSVAAGRFRHIVKSILNSRPGDAVLSNSKEALESRYGHFGISAKGAVSRPAVVACRVQGVLQLFDRPAPVASSQNAKRDQVFGLYLSAHGAGTFPAAVGERRHRHRNAPVFHVMRKPGDCLPFHIPADRTGAPAGPVDLAGRLQLDDGRIEHMRNLCDRFHLNIAADGTRSSSPAFLCTGRKLEGLPCAIGVSLCWDLPGLFLPALIAGTDFLSGMRTVGLQDRGPASEIMPCRRNPLVLFISAEIASAHHVAVPGAGGVHENLPVQKIVPVVVPVAGTVGIGGHPVLFGSHRRRSCRRQNAGQHQKRQQDRRSLSDLHLSSSFRITHMALQSFFCTMNGCFR